VSWTVPGRTKKPTMRNQGEADNVVHRVRHAGKQLEVATLDLSGSIDSLRDEIGKLAERVRALRRSSLELRQAA